MALPPLPPVVHPMLAHVTIGLAPASAPSFVEGAVRREDVVVRTRKRGG